MEPQNTGTPSSFESIFVTTIKTDSPNLHWGGAQKEPCTKVGGYDKCVFNGLNQTENPAGITCTTLSSTDLSYYENQIDSNKDTCGVEKRKVGNLFNETEVLADMKFCVPKSAIEKPLKLQDSAKGESSVAEKSPSKTRILKICKRLVQQKHVKVSTKKQWKKKGYFFKKHEEKVKQTTDDELFESSSAIQNSLVTAYTRWQSPEEMRNIFDKMCQVCYSRHEDETNEKSCPLLSPKVIVSDDSTSKLGFDLPKDIFLGYSRVYADRLSLFVRNATPKSTQFGPLKGRKVGLEDLSKLCLPDIDLDHFWPLKRTIKTNDYLTVDEYIDTKDEASSNWLRFLVPEHSSALFEADGSPLKANIQRVVKDDNIYFVTTRDIKMGEELFLRCLEPPERIYFNLTAMAASSGSSLNKTKVKVLLDDCTTCKGKLREKFPFQSIIRMVRHRRMMHNTLPAMCDYANIFHCNFCGKEFRFQTELRKHRTETHLVHDKQHNTQCQYCKIYKKSVDALSGHVSAVHFVNSKHPVTCTICGLQFSTHGKYQQHRVNDHRPDQGDGGDGKNQCNICGKGFKTYSTLRKHVWKVHEKKDYRVCETCGKSFKDKYQLKVHTLTHSGIKPFQCDIEGCTAAFTTKQWLQKHYRSAHSFTEQNMPEIQRKIDFSDNIILSAKTNRISQFAKQLNNQELKQNRPSDFELEFNNPTQNNPLEANSQNIESSPSDFMITGKHQQQTTHMMHENTDLSPSASSLSNGTHMQELTSHTQDFRNRDLLPMTQNCIPSSHFAALSQGMAVQNAIQQPRVPPPPLPPPFNEQQLAHGGRWITNQNTASPNQQMPHLQGVFDSSYYSMHDFY